MRGFESSTTSLALLASALLTLALAAPASAQERAGVVTTLQGNVTVARAALAEPAALKFRDDIFVSDRIASGKNGIARILLGGRAVVTIREHSVVTITELPGVATVDLVSGRAAVAVARERMQAGDVVELRTPNAVAGIRGTVVVGEVANDRSVITVLKGVIDVTRLDGGRAVGAATIMGALQQVTVVGAGPVPAPQAISSDTARRMGGEFRMTPPRLSPTATNAMVASAEVERTVRNFSVASASPLGPGDGGSRVGVIINGDLIRNDKDDKDKDRDTRSGTRIATPVFTGVAPTLGWSAPVSTTTVTNTKRDKDRDR
jgi:hypothetical protein